MVKACPHLDLKLPYEKSWTAADGFSHWEMSQSNWLYCFASKSSFMFPVLKQAYPIELLFENDLSLKNNLFIQMWNCSNHTLFFYSQQFEIFIPTTCVLPAAVPCSKSSLSYFRKVSRVCGSFPLLMKLIWRLLKNTAEL